MVNIRVQILKGRRGLCRDKTGPFPGRKNIVKQASAPSWADPGGQRCMLRIKLIANPKSIGSGKGKQTNRVVVGRCRFTSSGTTRVQRTSMPMIGTQTAGAFLRQVARWAHHASTTSGGCLEVGAWADARQNLTPAASASTTRMRGSE